jgi:hypothetical protein
MFHHACREKEEQTYRGDCCPCDQTGDARLKERKLINLHTASIDAFKHFVITLADINLSLFWICAEYLACI